MAKTVSINKFTRDLDTGKVDIDKTINTFQKDIVINRADITRRDTDNVEDPSIGIIDIDFAVKSFLQDKVKPTVEQDGKIVSVPVQYANQEKWSNIRASGYMRDEKGKLIAPAIVFNRTGIARRTDLIFNKVADSDANRMVFKKKFTKNNIYDKFSALIGSKPVEEYYSVDVPDYVDITYQMIIWCDFTTQINKLVEQLIYYSGQAWGEKYKFIVKADSFNFTSTDTNGEDRIVKATGDFVVKGHLVHKEVGKEANTKKYFSKSKILITSEASSDITHTVMSVPGAPDTITGTKITFISNPRSGPGSSGFLGLDSRITALETQTRYSGSFSGSFQGDGTNLTGITAEWDGSHNGNASITGTLNVTAGITGSLNYSNIVNAPTLISGSSQIASEISGAFSNVSSSLALRISNQESFSSSLDTTFWSEVEQTSYSQSLSTRFTTDELNISNLQTTASSHTILKNLGDGVSQIVQGSLTLTGDITARDYIISSSVMHYTQSFYSGSTKFGDTADDTHQFTGSLLINGSATAVSFTGIFNGALSGSAQIATAISGAFTATSSSYSTRVTNLETASGSYSTRLTNDEVSITLLNSKTGSYATTGSNIFIGDQTITGSIYVSSSIAIGGTSGARLSLPAGTMATAPIKMTSGDLLTYPLPGIIEFNSDDYYASITTPILRNPESQYPPAYSATYVKATSRYSGNTEPWFSCNPSLSLIGSYELNSWVSAVGGTNQRFHIDLGTDKTVTKIYYEPGHNSGTETNFGPKNFTFWGSNTSSSFADVTYSTDTGWTQLTTNITQMVQHPSSNVVDPQYITVTNTTSYRYYAFKFADTWGGNYMNVRRIELQTAETDYRKNIILDDGVKLTSGRIPVATTNGRLFDFNTFKYISGSGVELTGSINATSFSGSFSGSFYGNGSGLTNISAGSLPSGLLSGSAQIATEISGAFTVVSSSYSTRVTSLETKQSYSGSFSGSFSGNGSGLTNIVSASYAATASYALNSTALPSGLLSGSAQIATDISGAFTNASASFLTTMLKLDQTTAQTISNDTPIFNTLTALELVATTAAKKLQTLAVATYPSLTELSYLKGVSSSLYLDATDWSAAIGWTGFSVDPTLSSCKYGYTGKIGWINIVYSANGTSNATTFTITGLPITPNCTCYIPIGVVDNGVIVATPGRAFLLTGNTTITITKDMQGNGFTASGNKRTQNIFLTFLIQ